MSAGQRALWFEQCLHADSNAYNLAACVRFDQSIDCDRIDRVLALLVDRHPLLRARFDLVGEQPCWYTSAQPLTCSSTGERTLSQAEALERIADIVMRPYALADEHPFRFAVAAFNEGTLFAIGCHHIVCDLHSLEILVSDLDLAYSDTAPVRLAAPAEALGYADFCAWQADMLGASRGVKSAGFWKERLDGSGGAIGPEFPPASPGAAPGPSSRLNFTIAAQAGRALSAAAQSAGATPYTAALTTIQIMLAHRYRSPSVLVGTPFSARNDRRFHQTVGYFVNLVPMLFHFDAEQSFAHAVAHNGAMVRSALRHGQFPFSSMVEQLGLARKEGASPLVRATLTFQNTVSGLPDHLTRLALGLPGGGLRLAGELGRMLPLPEPRPQFPFGITIAPTASGFEGSLQYDPAQIAHGDARSFLADWLALIDRCAEQPDTALAALLGQTGARQRRSEDTLSAALEKSILRHASRHAIAGPDGAVSYRQLGERSAVLAARLQALGIGRGARVAVVGDGAADTVVAMVAVLRCGAAFVPIDIDAGVDQIESLVLAARASALLQCTATALVWRGGLNIAQLTVGADDFQETMATDRCEPLDPAWLMFTSGTTGAPKAAIVPHEAALAHARAIAQRFELVPEDRVLQFASLSFDEHAEEIFPTLLAGACLVCMPRIRFQDPERLLREVGTTGVTVLHLPTSYWHVWMDELAHHALPAPETLRLVNAGGEQASVSRLRTWSACMAPQVRWFNSYGLTEAAVTSLVYELPREDAALEELARVPVGKPIAGARFRIDAVQGEIAELLLGGAGVGLGYFDHPGAGSSFFMEAGEHGPVRWLRTGDMARVNAGGDVEIMGRLDRSIKLGGMRIALPELEAALTRHPAVKECVACAIEDDSCADKRVELHVVVLAGQAVTAAQLLEFLRKVWPTAPAPMTVHFHAAIARTAGRKPDYAKLRPAETSVRPSSWHLQGGDELSACITAIFARHLPNAEIAPSSDFFAIGGHSLLAMRIVAALRRDLAVNFSISDFLSGPTIEGVARLCGSRGALPGVQAGRPAAAATGQYPLSQAQRRALTLAAAGGADGEASVALMITGPVDAARIERAWVEVVTRHRLLYADISSSGNQERDVPAMMLQVRQIGLALPASLPQRHFANAARAALVRHADQPPVLRATLFAASDCRHVLFIDARHAAVDGACVMPLLREFAHACAAGAAAPSLLPPAGGYRQYVEAEAAWLASPAHARALAYWARYLENVGHPSTLPDMAVDRGDDFSSRRLGFAIARPLRERVLALARARRSTPFAVLLASFVALVHRYTLSDDILIGVPISLRDAFGMEGTLGPMLNALPFRASLAPGETFSHLLQRTQDALNAALEHAVLPLEQIAARCPGLRDTLGSPNPIQVVAQDEMSLGPDAGSLTFTQLPERNGHSPVALLVGVQTESKMRIELEYRSAILSDAAAVRFARAMRTLLRELVQAPDLPLSQARLLPLCQIRKALAQRPLLDAPGFPALLHDGLSAGARRHPERLAVVWGEQDWSYAQLDSLANRHAHRLIAAGLEEGGHVIVVSRKGIAEVVAILAILKAGGVYIPVAWDTPKARAAALAARTDARFVTGMTGFECVFGDDDGYSFIPVDLHAAPPVPAPAITPAAQASAYILFTSGSTGAPKGVEVSHRAALTTICEMLRRFDMGCGDVFYGFSELGFDLSVFDVFGALAAGGCLVLPSPETRTDAFAWVDDIVRHGVTICNTVPSALDMLLEACGAEHMPSLRRLLVSGDWIGLDLPARARLACPGAMFVALGGATEAGIWSNCHVVESVDPAWRSIPYGRALDGQSMFVAERGGWPAPVGVPGEICIGGAALANGYWGDPVLTAEKFVIHAQTGRRIYRTGDVGRYFADGSIEFLGRRDQQIKLRGHRIETGDIEAALSACAGVRRALIMATVGSTGLPEAIVAFVLAEDGALLDGAALRRHAESLLPPHMRPLHYRVLKNFPLSANGKIDWAALPVARHGCDAFSETDANALSECEHQLAAVWNKLIPGRLPGRDDNFFLAGGNSLMAVKLVATVRREFGPTLSLSRWLAEPTIAHLARLLDAARGAPVAKPPPAPARTALRERVHLAADLVFSPPNSNDAGSVFITGCTGLIGSHVVARLLSQTGHDLVCLVRNLDDTRAEGRLASLLHHQGLAASQWERRVRFVVGDLTQRRFGLGDADFAALAHAIETVFHIGANVNLVACYDALEAANVGGTHEAIRLAALAGASLHYVSSVGVLPYGAGKTITEADSIEIPGTLLTGYCETKWVAEQTVRRAVARGLRAAIYRPGLTLGDDAAGEHDMLALLLALAQKVGGLPDLDIPVDITTAAFVAAAIVHIAADDRSQGGTFHLTHPQPEQLGDLVRRARIRVPVLPFEVWRVRLENALPAIGDARVAALGAMISAQTAADITPARIDCTRTCAFLQGAGIVCAPVTAILSTRLTSAQ